MSTDPRLEAVLAGIFNGQPHDDDDPRDHEPDPPAWSGAESDRAADRYEAWLDAKATQ